MVGVCREQSSIDIQKGLEGTSFDLLHNIHQGDLVVSVSDFDGEG